MYFSEVKIRMYMLKLGVIPLLFLLVGCGDSNLPFFKSKKEGYIRYEVTFPNETGLMAQFYPKEMMFYFNENEAHAVLASAYNVVTTDFFVGQKDEFFSHYFKSYGDKQVIHMQHQNIHDWLKRYPDVRLEKTNEKMDIAGYPCEKTIAHFLNDSLPIIELYSTTAFGPKDNNWWNKFEGLDGVLMGYEVNLYGKRMKLRAAEVVFEKQDPSVFARPEGYRSVSFDEMDSSLKALSQVFSNS
ncbi:MAG: hypothetical protein RLY35_1872 [Bacteroidota bacterium]